METFPGDVRLTVCGRFSFLTRPPLSLALFSLNNTHSLPPTPIIPAPSPHRWSPDRLEFEAHLDDSLLHSLFSSQLRRRASRLPPAQSQRNSRTIPLAQPSANRLPLNRINMLLPSALPCDVRRSSRFTPSRLFSTPPPSDQAHPSGNRLLGTCRALQSLLNGSPAPSPRRSTRSTKSQRLQSPLPIHPPRRSPRSRKVARPASPRRTPPPTSIASTPPPPPSAPARGVNKRRRSSWDDEDRGRGRPSTPKRRRHVPYDLPLGLSSTDFYSLHSPPITQSPPSPAQHQINMRMPDFGPRIDPDAVLPSIEEPDQTPPAPSDEWSTEEDQRLIELVLEKFRLSQQEWDECARQIGRRNSADVGRRWSSLVRDGRVGLGRGSH